MSKVTPCDYTLGIFSLLQYLSIVRFDDIVQEDESNVSVGRSCNCRDKAACPVANNCLKSNVIYKATVQHGDNTQHYIGMTENTFKTRYTLHKSSLKHSKNRNQTELSNLIWTLK